jgi:hypothetical protein
MRGRSDGNGAVNARRSTRQFFNFRKNNALFQPEKCGDFIKKMCFAVLKKDFAQFCVPKS